MSIFKKSISRRKFIDLSAKGSAGLGLAQSLTLPVLSLSACAPKSKSTHGVCYHDCPDACSWTVTTENKRVTSFSANSSNPYTGDKLCGKMDNFPNDVTFHPNRILFPLKRVGKKGEGKFERVSWEQAIKEVATKTKNIISEKGAEAILPYSFAGTEGLVQRNSISDRFFTHIGASRLDHTICGNAAVAGVMTTNGQTTGVLPEDIVHSRFILLWGTNTVTSNQHLWPLIQQARSNGAKVVVVDPFQSHTAQQADRHIQPAPGTDTALAFGMIHVILRESLQDQNYVENHTIGIEELKLHVNAYDPTSVSKITRLDKEVIEHLAREYATASPSLIRVLIGLEHHANGANAFRAIAMLPALVGAWKQLGGGLMHMTYELFGDALNWSSVNFASTIQKPKTRLINMVQIGRALTDESLDPAVHGLFVFNSNPAVIAPDQNAVLKGLKREDLFTVVLEHFITDTAKYADYVFPATSQLEHWDLLTSWGQPYLNLNEPAIAPLGEAKSNTEFFRQLAKELGFNESYLYESDLEIIKTSLNSDHEYLRGIDFEYLKSNGWAKLNVPKKWMPHEKGNFKTASGKCEFFNATVDPPIATYTPVAHDKNFLKKYPLQLLSIKSTRNFLNSSHANVDHLLKNEGLPKLDISKQDAEARGIEEGRDVKVFNGKGEVRIQVQISEKVRPGVVSIPQGFWVSLVEGGSTANALTDDRLTDMGGGAALQETMVEVQLV